MTLTLDEKEKLLNKATKLYNELKDIKIRREIRLDITKKYYPSGCRGSNSGFTYYESGSICCDSEDIKNSLENLKNYVNFKKYNGEEYVNGKSVNFMSSYEIYALLDFVYNFNYIKTRVEEINEKERQVLKDLLD